MKLFSVNIMSEDEILYNGRASSLIVPAKEGYLGVLADHAPLIAGLIKGRIELQDESGSRKDFSCEGVGFLEVIKNTATIILQ